VHAEFECAQVAKALIRCFLSDPDQHFPGASWREEKQPAAIG